MLRHAASSLVRQPGETLTTLQAGVEAVADLGIHNRELAGRGEGPPPGFFAAPRTSFNGAVSNRKRYATLSVPLEDVKLVNRVFEATVNDVLLACVSGGLRRLLAARDERVDSHSSPWCRSRPGPTGRPRSSVIRSRGCSCRWRATSTTLWRGSTRSRNRPAWPRNRRSCTGAASSATWRRSRFRHWSRVSPVPSPGRGSSTRSGRRSTSPSRACAHPTSSLFCAGSRVVGMYPVGPMAEGIGVNVTVFSYLDRVYFGMLACRRLIPELAELAIHVDDALGELVACALDAQGATA